MVHFHNIEGFSAGCIPAIRRGHRQARILYSLHNYHTLCPQVYLMQGHRRPCFDYDNGHACRTCIPTVDPAHERVRALAKLRGEEIPPQWSDWPKPPVPMSAPEPAHFPEQRWWQGIARSVRATIAGQLHAAETVATAEAPPAPPPPEIPWMQPWIERPARKPLLNIIQPEPPSAKPPAPWARRREAMVAMLNNCDQVLAVSTFVRDKFIAAGVQPGKIQTLPIGTRMTELASAMRGASVPLAQPMPPVPPIRMVFMGYHNWYKGLPMLAESLALLTPEYLRHIDLRIYALGGEQMEPEFRALEPHLAALTFQHGYRYEEIPALLQGAHLGLVTSVWWDNAPQTVMEFLACGIPVLAAELGGIPDFVKHGHNGLLFRGNDRWDLARTLADVIREPGQLPALRTNVRPPRSIAQHVDELLRHYATPLS
jgi:glycosyltransferase involved in cell wall biosynthesis